ncbi:uncharacterized protein J4E79_004341 [Alternaria viburni]|uniref:uncharacterized protein n=1 Tax=Alternaria viburni TaxID=566460 RepID=UPI0020C361D0|nr:uncharacterized protein J4E79_004341 [Alternaria viburni]KAI4663029.1 hypothetical protein J4E79_004341 [Alternaria viburni]
MFGFHVPTVCGKFVRTTKWEKTWTACFTNLLNDVIKYDNETNGHWPEFDAACKQVIAVVIPRLLGALQSDGRNIEPVLIHGDLWEQNVGIDMETGDTILFDPGAYNDMLYLCEKYAPLEGLGTYRPENDVSVTGAYIEHETTKMSHLHHAVKT